MALSIVLNGERRGVDAATTIADLLVLLELPARQVAVEVNMQLVPREQHARHVLRDGDELEIVTLVGGG